MSDKELTVISNNAIQSVADIRSNVNTIQKVMQAIMIGPSKEMPEGVHYGVIPGTQKPTLYKAGAEVLASTFRLAPSYIAEDLSGEGFSRYRVTCRLTHQATGYVMGDGMGACSSMEEKYKWRRPVCDKEYDTTPENMRRVKFARGRNNTIYENKQVRTEAADLDNTILKMACKRAFVAAVLNVTAASDIFSQDLEDLPENLRDAHDDIEPKKAPEQPQRKSEQSEQKEDKTKPVEAEGPLRDNQIKIIKAKITASGSIDESAMFHAFEAKDYSDIPASRVNDVLNWIKENG